MFPIGKKETAELNGWNLSMLFGLYAFDDFWKDQVEAERKSGIGLPAVQSLKHGNMQHAQTPSYRWNMK